MAEEAQQRVDSIELYQQMVEVWHCGDHVHFLDDVVQIQLRLHEPDVTSRKRELTSQRLILPLTVKCNDVIRPCESILFSVGAFVTNFNYSAKST